MVYNDSEKSSDKFALKGKLDLITVDSKGNAHIFEIKVSKNRDIKQIKYFLSYTFYPQ